MGHDLRYGVRLLVRNPLFALTAIASLAIGIGANTTIFTLADALLFHPPAAVRDPTRLVDVGRSQNGQGFDNASYPNYLDIRSRNTVFDDVYAYRFGAEPMGLGVAGGAERVFGDMVTLNYFDVLGVHPHVGRLFGASDSEAPGAAPIAVLSYSFWQRRFNGQPAVVGSALSLNGRPFTVVGVAPEGFHGTSVLTGDLWVPMNMVDDLSPRRSESILRSRSSAWLLMGARLKPGVSVQQAQAQVAGIGRELEREFPVENRGKGVRVVSQSPIPGNGAPFAAFFAILMGFVSLILAIACANVAGVLLARAAARRREIAVRLAIGAGRARLVRQLLAESTVLFLLGGAAGLLVARTLTSLLVSLLPTLPVPVDISLPLDVRAIAFTLIVSMTAAILAGLMPALHSARADVVGDLKGEGGAPIHQRLRNAFVVGQVAFSIVLVVAAALLGRALTRAAAIDPGFDPHGVDLASLDLSLAGYTADSGPVFAADLIDRVRHLPGVESAALAAMVPLGGGGLGLGGLKVPGTRARNTREWLNADWNVVTPGYFATMKIALAAGRDFSDQDRGGAPAVVIVNETAARQWWSDPNPIGKTLLQETGTREKPDAARALTVIGIARDTKYRDLGESPRPFVYVPVAQQYLPRLTIVARSTHGQRVAAELRRLVTTVNPNLPVVQQQTFDDYASLNLLPQRVAAAVSGSLGAVGLVLAAMGIYGVTAFMVTSRTREIGVRVALGARRADIVRMVLRQGLRLTLAGAAIGVVLAAASARLLGSMLLSIGPGDPVAFGGSAFLFVLAGMVACWVPARRAAALDAMRALRRE